ncbi:hypothetical protein HDV02_005336 [Globomyces sp. JEL0801]|nr:hypothetical protein HDV02_005336 [Globomyces sp. JEL0801]
MREIQKFGTLLVMTVPSLDQLQTWLTATIMINQNRTASLPLTLSVHFTITPKMDRGFFLASGDWTCYRRNYFQISSAFSIQDSDGQDVLNQTCVLHTDGINVNLVKFKLGIDARVSAGDRKIGLVQHTPKRDKGPQMVPQPKELLAGGNPHQYNGLSANQFIATFERLQFKSATANNGKRRAAQQFFCILISLYGMTEDGRTYKIAFTESAPLVVRGRSPGHYTDMNDAPNTNSAKSAELHVSDSATFPPSSANGLISPSYQRFDNQYSSPYPNQIQAQNWIRARDDSAGSIGTYMTNDSYMSNFDDKRYERPLSANGHMPFTPQQTPLSSQFNSPNGGYPQPKYQSQHSISQLELDSPRYFPGHQPESASLLTPQHPMSPARQLVQLQNHEPSHPQHFDHANNGQYYETVNQTQYDNTYDNRDTQYEQHTYNQHQASYEPHGYMPSSYNQEGVLNSSNANPPHLDYSNQNLAHEQLNGFRNHEEPSPDQNYTNHYSQ